jgi:uncharacterized protein
MKVLVDINHPAHVHFFRNLILELRKNEIETIITASKKDIALDLLKIYNLQFINLGNYGDTPFIKLLNIPIMAIRMVKVVLKEHPDLMIGIGSSRITHAGFLLGVKTFVFTDTEHAKEQIILYKYFASKIYTPNCFLSNLGKRQIRYPSYHELAYLHPNRFTPSDVVLKLLGIGQYEKFFIVRFVSWNASHDIGQSGLSNEGKIMLVEKLNKFGKVIITSEGELPKDLEPYKMRVPANLIHDLLYFAEMYIGEGGTMASEAAVLGTPSIFVSTLKAGTFEELIHKYHLLIQCFDDKSTIDTCIELLKNSNLKIEWRDRQKVFLSQKIDTTEFMYDQIQSFIDKKN